MPGPPVKLKGSTLYIYNLNVVLKVVYSSLSGFIRRLLKAEIISKRLKYFFPANWAIISWISGIGYGFFLLNALSLR